MYNKYLWQPLNEMYYGKHPLLLMIEKYFRELKQVIKSVKIKRAQEKHAYGSDENLPKRLRGRIKKISDFEFKHESYNIYKNSHLYMKNLNEAKNKQDIFTDAHLYEIMENLVNSSRLAMAAIMTEEQVKQLKDIFEQLKFNEDDFKRDYKELIATKSGPIAYGTQSYFYIDNVNDENYYMNLIKNICSAWMSLFKFPGVTLDIFDSEMVNAFYYNSDVAKILLSQHDFSKTKNIAVSKWINNRRLNDFKSDNNSIYFKDYFKTPVHIFISTGTLMKLPEESIVAILLHEIGHSFGFKLLPIEYSKNLIVQEKFADAFATKFGYGAELIKGLKMLMKSSTSIYIMDVFGKYGTRGLRSSQVSNEMRQYLKLKLMLKMLVTKYDTKGDVGMYDAHPANAFRYKEQLEHLMVELNNPRLSPIKKRELQRDIDIIRKEIPNYGEDEMEKFLKQMDDTVRKTPNSRKEELDAQKLLSPKILRDILDKIYDQSMK